MNTDRGVTRLKLGYFIFACCAARDFVNSDHSGHRQRSAEYQVATRMEMERGWRNVLRLTFTFCVLENIVVFVRPPPDAECLFSKRFPSVSIFHSGP